MFLSMRPIRRIKDWLTRNAWLESPHGVHAGCLGCGHAVEEQKCPSGCSLGSGPVSLLSFHWCSNINLSTETIGRIYDDC